VSDEIQVLIVDDHAVLRSGLKLMLDREDDIVCVGEVGTAEEGLRAVLRLAPAVVVMDLQMPGMGGIAGVAKLREQYPDVAVLVLSMHDEADEVRRAFEAGAHGYVLKTAADEELVRAIRAVAAGERYVHSAVGAILAQPSNARGPVDELSPREREVLRLLALGYTNQEIAKELVVSVRTVESHRSHVMTKLRANSRAEMVRYALKAGLLEEDEA
jgi:two-component system, NarL family, response regulator NreC